MSSASDRSQSRDRDRDRNRDRSRSKGRVEKHKMFVTNLDGIAKQDQLQTELQDLFEKYGKLKQLEVKRSKNGQYSFAFVQYQLGEDAEEAIRNLNNYMIKGKPMKVEFQDDSKRRKDPKVGCYTCGKKGHFARQCRSKNNNDYRRRSRSRSKSKSRSRSSSDRRDRRRRRRSQTPSSQKRRSRHKKDKDRKHSKDKKKKKHKKHKRRSSSDSES